MARPRRDSAARGARPGRIVLACAIVATGMTGLAYASVPFYRAFCQATGFNGTPRRGEAGPRGPALSSAVTVHFDTNVRRLDWTFRPVRTQETVRIGRTTLAYFTVRNDGATAVTGRAAYNVSPEAAAAYFLKLQCFCFSDQTVPAKTQKTFPVVFYVDRRFAADDATRAIQDITLSYTFFPAPDARPARG